VQTLRQYVTIAHQAVNGPDDLSRIPLDPSNALGKKAAVDGPCSMHQVLLDYFAAPSDGPRTGTHSHEAPSTAPTRKRI
jgi:hypothetical protein